MSSPLKCLVVDDEPTAQEILVQYVQQHSSLKLENVCDSAIEAANVLRESPVDLLLLDVQMPEMSGLELIEATDTPPHVILVTSSEDYAVEAFDLDVTDYLVKPIRYARFLTAIDRVEEEIETASSSVSGTEAGGPASDSDDGATQDRTKDYIFLKVDSSYVRVELDEIQLVEAKGDYVLVSTSSEQHMIHSTMKDIQKRLPSDQFARVHRSYIVRVDQIEKIDDDSLTIGANTVRIGPTFRENLLETIETL